MKITSVTYRTNVSLGNYRTKHVEATAQVEKGDKPSKVLLKLAKWVHAQLGLPYQGEIGYGTVRDTFEESRSR